MPRILCAGIAVLDEVFRVQEFPAPDAKVEARVHALGLLMMLTLIGVVTYFDIIPKH